MGYLTSVHFKSTIELIHAAAFLCGLVSGNYCIFVQLNCGIHIYTTTIGGLVIADLDIGNFECPLVRCAVTIHIHTATAFSCVLGYLTASHVVVAIQKINVHTATIGALVVGDLAAGHVKITYVNIHTTAFGSRVSITLALSAYSATLHVKCSKSPRIYTATLTFSCVFGYLAAGHLEGATIYKHTAAIRTSFIAFFNSVA